MNFRPPDHVQRARAMIESVGQGLRTRHRANFALMHEVSSQRTLEAMRQLLDCWELEPEVVEHLLRCLGEMLRCANVADEDGFLDIMISVNQYIQRVAADYCTN